MLFFAQIRAAALSLAFVKLRGGEVWLEGRCRVQGILQDGKGFRVYRV